MEDVGLAEKGRRARATEWRSPRWEGGGDSEGTSADSMDDSVVQLEVNLTPGRGSQVNVVTPESLTKSKSAGNSQIVLGSR